MAHEETPTFRGTFHMSDGLYNKLKFLALVLLPALGTLYAALAALYVWGYTEQVLGTVLAVDTFLGIVLGISNSQHQTAIAQRGEGSLIVDEDGSAYAEFGFDPADASPGDAVTLRVVKP